MVVAHTTTDSARARGLLGREVGGGVARAAVGRGGRAQQHGAERAAPASSRRRPATTASTAPDGAEQVAGDEPDAAAAAAHQPGEQEGRGGGAEHLEGLRQPGHALAAGDVAGEQGGGRDADRDADRADGLRDHQRADGPRWTAATSTRDGSRVIAGLRQLERRATRPPRPAWARTPASSASTAVRLPSSPITNSSAQVRDVRAAERVVEPVPELGVPHARTAETSSHDSAFFVPGWCTISTSRQPAAGHARRAGRRRASR